MPAVIPSTILCPRGRCVKPVARDVSAPSLYRHRDRCFVPSNAGPRLD